MQSIGIHFIHERGKGPNPFPLILTHGYPDSFYRFAKIIPLLTDPASHGGRAGGGDIESRFTEAELLTQIMIYWATESIGPSFLTYYDFANAGALTWTKEGMKKWTGSSKVPAAFALFPADISLPPREWAERFFNVQRWTEMPRGGHFQVG